MGYGALIGSLVSAGVSIYGDLSKSGGPNLGEYSSTLNRLANQYVTPFAQNPNYWNLDIPGMAGESIQYGLQQAPAINQSNMQQLQMLLDQALPGYQGMIGQMQANTESLLQGTVPQDVQDQIRRNVAQRTITSGIGFGGAGQALTANAGTARSLGLTSLDLMGRGESQATGLVQLASNYLMPQPVNPLSLLPLQDLIAGKQWSDTANYQANLAAYTAKANAAAARVGAPTSQLAGVAGALGGLNQSLLKTNPQTGQTGYGMLSQLFGGGGGGGGGIGGMTDPTYGVPISSISGLTGLSASDLATTF